MVFMIPPNNRNSTYFCFLPGCHGPFLDSVFPEIYTSIDLSAILFINMFVISVVIVYDCQNRSTTMRMMWVFSLVY